MKKHYYLVLVAFLCMAQGFAATIYVKPGGTGNGTTWALAYGSLVTALANAQPGDMIWVQQGIYKPSATLDTNASFVFKNGVQLYGGFSGTETTLAQRADTSGTATILSGELSSTLKSKTIVKVTNATSTLNLLDGFTIQGASWTIVNVVTGGAGMQITGSTLEVRNVTIKDNAISVQHTSGGSGWVGGAGLYGYQSNISLYNVDVVNNTLFTTSTVANPQIICGGAGIMMYNGTLNYVKGNVHSNDVSFEDLYAVGGGGYFYVVDSIYIQDVLVDYNTGTDDYGYGAGLSINSCPDVEIIQGIFNSNSTSANGDDLSLMASNVVITNSTFSSVNGSQPTSLIHAEGSTISFNNSVFLGQITANITNTVTYNNCISTYGFGFGTYNNVVVGEMQFIDPGSGNFTPTSCSPHLNLANSSLNPLPTDFNGNPRTVGAGMDMGAIELQNLWVNNRVYVDGASVNTMRDGASWESAFTTLDEALNCGCVDGDVVINPEVWVAEGMYKPRVTPEGKYSTFKLNANQRIYGGFASGATSPDERDLTWEVHPTILSGHIADDYYLFSIVNSRYHDATTELNGFIIEDGRALDPSGWGRSGAAVYVRDGRPTLNNLWIRNNETDSGGAVYVYDAGVLMDNIKLTDNIGGATGAGMEFVRAMNNSVVLPPTIITNIEASNNASLISGGGAIWIGVNYNVSIEGFHFANNTGRVMGGAVVADRATLNLSRGVFESNGITSPVEDIVGSGGGLYIQGIPGHPSYVTIESVQFTNNTAQGAGALYMSHSLVDVVNCTFAGNEAIIGANLFGFIGGTIAIKNSIIDNPDNGHPAVTVYPASTATNPMYTLVNSIVTDGFTPIFTISPDVLLNTDPLFIDAENGDYNITACGPAVDAGINALLELNPVLDAAGNPRIKNATVDLGALEYQYIDLAVAQPANLTVAPGTQAQFAVLVNLPGMNYQWQVSTDNGSTWTDIPNATTATLQTVPVTTAMSGYLYRLRVWDCDHAGISGAAVLTVSGTAGIANNDNPLGMRLYPNPGRYGFTLTMDTATTNGIVTIYDVQGRAITQRTISAQALTNGIAIDASAWAAGVYWVSFNGEQQHTIKFIKE